MYKITILLTILSYAYNHYFVDFLNFKVFAPTLLFSDICSILVINKNEMRMTAHDKYLISRAPKCHKFVYI